jgi:BirA family biotin operon repressor/biotin-[acetyl-CoA-carboxylase] ligase
MENSFFIQETASTNELLWKMLRENTLAEGFVVRTDFQTSGKGQIGNLWESESGKNLLFSMALFPQKIRPDQQFLISQLVSVSIKKALDEYVDDVTVKWPNDIYWKDKKLAGILIENSLQGRQIKFAVVGIGLNVNQTEFVSNAPNPISLRQIAGKRIARNSLLKKICQNIMDVYHHLDVEKLQMEYADMLFRKDGFHTFKADGELFQARIFAVHPDGMLELETIEGEYRSFYFKEVSFVIC